MDRSIAEALEEVRARVGRAAERSGRSSDAVTIVGVVKEVDVPALEEAYAAGLIDLGANRADDLAAKAAAIPGARWHYIGSIQTNKVRLLDPVTLVHGVDRIREAEALTARDRTWDVLLEVNIAGEATKQGVAPADVEPLLDAIRAYPTVRPRGLMFVAPQAENAEDVRWVFEKGRTLLESLHGYGLTELSMGMSEDYEVAIEEGATIVRVGRAIFRPEEL